VQARAALDGENAVIRWRETARPPLQHSHTPVVGKRSAQAREGRRRQGSKPDGRDSARGAGHSPRAWRRQAETHDASTWS